jgi:hypothetical protein
VIKLIKLILKKQKKQDNDIKIQEPPTISPLILTDMTAINYFRFKFGGEILNKQVCTTNVENNRQNFKKLVKQQQLKTLFLYIKDRTKAGLYKKEGNRVIGEYFGVGKDLIGSLIKQLEDQKYIGKLNELDKFYKLLREEF